MNTLGMRHIALNVKDAQASKDFYCKVLKMQVEWEPDAQNVYLTNAGQDNLAIHEVAGTGKPAEPSFGSLDHLGFFVPTLNDVDEWYEHVKSSGAKILREIKTHRDGARSFYFADLDGVTIQLLYHIPIAEAAASKT
jgi:catechol 2,3-dioxygenase-like lactoylglutathione lyase family enzyme